MLTVCTWWWGKKYAEHYVQRLAAGINRHLVQPYRFVCFTDDTRKLLVECASIRDRDLLAVPGCFARLRMFDPEAQRATGLKEGDRLVCFDLDAVITGPLDYLFNRPEPFVILQGANATNPCPYNGSLMMLRAGAHPEVWSDFSLKAASKVPFHEFPDDQAWLAHKVPNAAGWKCGSKSGVYAFLKPGWPRGDELPKDARIVAFPGRRDPWMFEHLPWVKENWRA